MSETNRVISINALLTLAIIVFMGMSTNKIVASIDKRAVQEGKDIATKTPCAKCKKCDETKEVWFKKHNEIGFPNTKGWYVIEGENRRKLVMVVNTIQGSLMVYDPEQRDSFKPMSFFQKWRWIGYIDL